MIGKVVKVKLRQLEKEGHIAINLKANKFTRKEIVEED